MQLSIVIPAYNEADSLPPLLAEIRSALGAGLDYEVIVVDDGSTDGSAALLRHLAAQDSRLRLLRHRRNAGQSLALISGVRAARAPWVATLDGDGQNDPADIPRLLAARDAAPEPPRLGMVAGQRQRRRDDALRRLSSRIANAVRGTVLRDGCRDSGCGIKLIRRESFLSLPHFDHLHRFLPALLQRQGDAVLYLPVQHRPRRSGQSKYGVWNRLGVGLVDLFGVAWLQRRACRVEIEEEIP